MSVVTSTHPPIRNHRPRPTPQTPHLHRDYFTITHTYTPKKPPYVNKSDHIGKRSLHIRSVAKV